MVEKVNLPYGRAYNFSAGPATLPLSVLETAHSEFFNYKNSGQSVMEMSHRSKVYIDIFETARKNLRQILNIPDSYEVLILQGGGTLIFSAIIFNLVNIPVKEGEKPTIDYFVTGDWSKKAADEAKNFSQFVNVNIVADGKSNGYTSIPDPATWKFTPGAAFVHYCANETIRGLEFLEAPPVPEGTILVSDMSSDFLSRPFDIKKFGVVYGGAQKNAGIAGATIVIVRKDLLNRAVAFTPSSINFKKQADKASMLNTPPTYSAYICGLYYDYIIKLGGLGEVLKVNEAKAKLIYDVVNASGGYYKLFVTNPAQQSIINIPLRCLGGGEENADKMTPHELKFVSEATKLGLINLKGYRDLGGIRVSLYSGLTLEGAKTLALFMVEFQKNNPPLK